MYQLNEKARGLVAYQPVTQRLKIHMDANESFVQVSSKLMDKMNTAIREIPFNRYPDPAAEDACQAFSELYGVSRKCVVAGNGSDELISVLFNVFLERGEAFATVEPDFSMYSFYGHLCEGRYVPIKKREDFTVDVDRVIETCNTEAVKMLIFSNPCNPTSLGLTSAEVLRIISEVQGLVVVDEAYMDFWEESVLQHVEEFDNLIILKTCSKALGMAGIRLGFAVASQPLTNVLMAAKSPYNVNSVTQCLGTLVMKEKEMLSKAFGDILESKIQLEKELQKISEKIGGFTLLSGCANFVSLIMETPENFYAYLTQAGIAVRCTAGLIRVTSGLPEENQAFLSCAEKYFVEG